jgi:hypothetical protein
MTFPPAVKKSFKSAGSRREHDMKTYTFMRIHKQNCCDTRKQEPKVNKLCSIKI